MNISDNILEIETLGQFRLSVAGKEVAANWPDETMKLFFCSILSPLDLYLTWDRVCRSMLGVPETRASRSQLEEDFIRPLKSFLRRELGFNPLIAGREDIRINQEQIHLDARDFHDKAIEGLRLISLGKNIVAQEKLERSASLYSGSYLPGMSCKIISSTRNELESLYQIVIMNGAGYPSVNSSRIPLRR